MNDVSVQLALLQYIDTVQLARSVNTARTYRNALNKFVKSLEKQNINPNELLVREVSEDVLVHFISFLKNLSPSTERLYITALFGFLEYLTAESLAEINLPRARLIIRTRARKPGQRLPQFDRNMIETVIDYVSNLHTKESDDASSRLRNLRDAAVIITLSDTGLRIHELCALRRGDIDWFEGKAMIVGKGNKQAVVRFSTRSIQLIKKYLNSRAILDGNSGKALASLPLFARHDKGAGKKIKPISTATGRNIVNERVKEAVGPEHVGTITPHSFRHYFVTTILFGSGGNLKLAQVLARHQNIAVTQRYAHLSDKELDEGYFNIFEND